MNKVWLFACGEPLSIDGDNVRLHRGGKIANYLNVNKNTAIDLFSSTFDHVSKQNRFLKTTQISIKNNFKLHLLKTIPYKKNISIMRLISNFVLGINLFFFLKKQNKKPDIIFVAFPPIETSLALLIYAKINKIKIIVDVRDLWPEIFIDRYNKYKKFILSLFLTPYRIMTKFIFKNTNSLLSISEKMLTWSQEYSNRKKTEYDNFIPFSYIHVEDYEFINTTKLKQLREKIENKFVISMIGNVTTTIGIKSIEDAAKRLSSQKDIFFLICGAGDLLEDTKKNNQNSKNIFFTGWINQNEIQFVLRNSKIGLIPYKSDMNLSTAIPNKFSEYTSTGLPIFSSLIGEVSNLIEKENIGEVYDFNSGKDLSEKILKLYNNKNLLREYSKNSKNLFLKNFEENKNHEKIFEHINRVYCS